MTISMMATEMTLLQMSVNPASDGVTPQGLITYQDNEYKAPNFVLDFDAWMEMDSPFTITVMVHAHPKEKTKLEIENT